MEKHLERKIKEVYQNKDARANFQNKEALWSGISAGLGLKTGVASAWRIAAILLALLAFGGAFASFSVLSNQKTKLKNLQNENQKFAIVIDSLKNIQPEIQVKTEIVEKEKLVYKNVYLKQENIPPLNNKVLELERELQQLTTQVGKQKIIEKMLRDSLEMVRLEMDTSVLPDQVDGNSKKTELFELKTEPYKEQIQLQKQVQSPKLKVQLFNPQQPSKSFDSNTTLFKK